MTLEDSPTTSQPPVSELSQPYSSAHGENINRDSTADKGSRSGLPAPSRPRPKDRGTLTDKPKISRTKLAPKTPPAFLPHDPLVSTINITNCTGPKSARFLKCLRGKGNYHGPHLSTVNLTLEELIESVEQSSSPPRKRLASQAVGQQSSGYDDDDHSPSSKRMRALPQRSLPSPCTDLHELSLPYSGYQEPKRPKEPDLEAMYQCTLGCGQGYDKKADWQRHEKTHYPPEIWICCHDDCLDPSRNSRVSFRKDLINRHYQEHHNKGVELGGADEEEETAELYGIEDHQQKKKEKKKEKKKKGVSLSEGRLAQMMVIMKHSLFPKLCVFENCVETFPSWKRRSCHVADHLSKRDILMRGRIHKYNYSGGDTIIPTVTGTGPSEYEGPFHSELKADLIRDIVEDDEHGQAEDDDEEEDAGEEADREDSEKDDDDDDKDNDKDEDEEDDDDDDDDDPDIDWMPEGNPDADSGASGGGSNNTTGHYPAEAGSWAPGSQQQTDYPQSFSLNNYYLAIGFDTFGGSGYISGVDRRPWRSLKSLRLELLPQIFARGITQTPLVLKKIQLQAALALELSGVKKTQITNILRQEIAGMARALAILPGRTLYGLPRSTAITNLQPSLELIASKPPLMVKQDQAIVKFSGLQDPKTSLDESLVDDTTNTSLTSRFSSFKGGHIYHCLPIRSAKAPIKPSRLIHIGSMEKPLLHLHTSEGLPKKVNYCTLSHCWDDGYALNLRRDNMASLKDQIPKERLTNTFHIAINIARKKGIEYIWIETLCILQDSTEDLIAEAPRITSIHASATFAIMVTTITSTDTDDDDDDDDDDDESKDITGQKDHLHQLTERSISTYIPETPEMTCGPSAIDTDSTNQRKPSTATTGHTQQLEEFVPSPMVRRDSAQLKVSHIIPRDIISFQK